MLDGVLSCSTKLDLSDDERQLSWRLGFHRQGETELSILAHMCVESCRLLCKGHRWEDDAMSLEKAEGNRPIFISWQESSQWEDLKTSTFFPLHAQHRVGLVVLSALSCAPKPRWRSTVRIRFRASHSLCYHPVPLETYRTHFGSL